MNILSVLTASDVFTIQTAPLVCRPVLEVVVVVVMEGVVEVGEDRVVGKEGVRIVAQSIVASRKQFPQLI